MRIKPRAKCSFCQKTLRITVPKAAKEIFKPLKEEEQETDQSTYSPYHEINLFIKGWRP